MPKQTTNKGKSLALIISIITLIILLICAGVIYAVTINKPINKMGRLLNTFYKEYSNELPKPDIANTLKSFDVLNSNKNSITINGKFNLSSLSIEGQTSTEANSLKEQLNNYEITIKKDSDTENNKHLLDISYLDSKNGKQYNPYKLFTYDNTYGFALPEVYDKNIVATKDDFVRK